MTLDEWMKKYPYCRCTSVTNGQGYSCICVDTPHFLPVQGKTELCSLSDHSAISEGLGSVYLEPK